MSTHTPGPWTLEVDANDQQCVYAGECFIAVVPHQCVASIEAQQQINARLIVSAPDMLEALHIAVDALDNYSDVNDGEDGPVPNRAMAALVQIQAAIQKAEG